MAIADARLPYPVTHLASMVDLKFVDGPPPRNYDDAQRADRAAFAAFYHAMRERGVLLAPSSNELMFLSAAHGDAEIDATVAAARAALAALKEAR